MVLTLDLVRRFEQHMAGAVESLLRQAGRCPGTPRGYALFREGPVVATLSTNPRAGWATQTYGVTGQPADAVRRVVEFFHAHGVLAKMRVVPDGFTLEQADVLTGLGLRHVNILDRLRPLRRTWLGSKDRCLYLAYVDERPAAQAILHWRDDLAYLESAGTLSAARLSRTGAGPTRWPAAARWPTRPPFGSSARSDRR